MREWLLNLVTPHFKDEDLNRQAFNLNVVLLVLLGAIVLGVVAMLLQIGQRPLSYMLPNTMFLVGAGLVLVLCYYLSRRGHVLAGSLLFVGMLTVACLGAVAVGGIQGALPAILIIPVSIAGITLGSGASVGLAVLSVGSLILIGFLEANGIITIEYAAPETTIVLNIFDVAFGLFFATIGIWLAGYSLRRSLERTQQAVAEAGQYRQDLEASLAMEQAVHDRLERAIGEYVAFLERIGEGDYGARLALEEEDQRLRMLEAQINATVDTLVSALERSEDALKQAEAAQNRYILQSWQQYSRSLPTAEFEVARSGTEAQAEELRSALGMALAQDHAVALTAPGQREVDEASPSTTLAAPIKLRDQVIGVLGIRREGDAAGAWTEAEQELIAAIGERLALSADGLRLLEDVQKRAAQERLVAEVGTRIRETLDMDTILRTAAQELRQAMGLSRLAVHLAAEPDGPDGA